MKPYLVSLGTEAGSVSATKGGEPEGDRGVALKAGADHGGLVRIRRGAVIDCHPGPLIINRW